MPNEITEQAGLGQAITPEQWSQFVLDHLAHEAVVLASGATRVDTDAKQIHVPRLTDDGGTDWYDELEEIDTGAPQGVDLVLTPKKLAALIVLSNESVSDASPSLLDTTGLAILRAIALEADRAAFHGTGGKQPVGILEGDPLPSQAGAVGYETLVRAAGKVRAAGGRPNVAYLSPVDLTGLQLVTAADDRPLIQPDAAQGAAPTVAGLMLFPTPALEEGEAVVGQSDQIVVAVRRDASVEFSTDAKFTRDATVARVIARLDIGVNDPDGLCVIGPQGS